MKKRKQTRRLRLEALAARQLMAADGFGDFNGDGFDDMVATDRTAVVSGQSYAGSLQVTYGSRQGLNAKHLQTLTQNAYTKAESGDGFGETYAVGDFNRDGFDDLAVGSPNEDIGKVKDAGLVSIFYGSKQGLRTNNAHHLHQNVAGIQGTAESYDNYGASLAAGDFDGDGYDDLAIGAPSDSVNRKANAGIVNVVYGSKVGLGKRDAIYSQDTRGVRGVAEKNDRFGASLAAGDFNGDGRDDLAIGVPGEDVGKYTNAGVVQILYGARRSLTTVGDGYHYGGSEVGDGFGFSLAAGDFNGDGRDDLAVGAPAENIGKIKDAGAVTVMYGQRDGLQQKGTPFYQGNRGIAGTAEAGDKFGFSLATGDIDGDGHDELVVGTPHEDHSGRIDAGALTVIFGSRSGLGSRDVILSQAIDAIAGAAESYDRFAYDVALGDFNGDGKADLTAKVSGENFGALKTPDAMNVIYGTRSSLAKGRNEMWVTAPATRNGNGFQLSETTPVNVPAQVTGSFLVVSEEIPVDIPAEVSGSFLVDFDPHTLAVRGTGDTKSFSYNDIQQRQSASCIFSASLAAVARTDFNFSSHIRYAGTDGVGYKYKVKLYDYKTLKPEWVTVRFDGTRDAVDMGKADKGEVWTTIYLRAYAQKYGFQLSDIDATKNSLYRSSRTALQTITGVKSQWNDFVTSSLIPKSVNRLLAQQKLSKALAKGQAVLAATLKTEDLKPLTDIRKAGLVAGHGYTVLSIENVGKTNATVTLRNPWGKDNSLSTSQYNDGFSANSRFEGAKVNNVKQDGLIRISWSNFQTYFQGFRTSAV